MPTISKKTGEKKVVSKNKKTTSKSKTESVKKKPVKKIAGKKNKKPVSKPSNKIIVDIISDNEDSFPEYDALNNKEGEDSVSSVYSSWPNFDKSQKTEDILSELDEEETIDAEETEEYDKQKKFFSDWAKQNAPKEDGEKPRLAPGKKSIGLYRRQAVFYLGATIILLLAVIYFFFIKLTILVYPQGETINDSVSFSVISDDTASSTGSSTDINNKIIEGSLQVKEISAEKAYQTSSEDVSEDGDVIITGSVVLINKYNKNQTLVATTRLLSPDGKLFRLKEAVNIPAGGKVTANVYANTPGMDMETEANTRFTIPGLWAGIQDRIYAENSEPLTYQPQTKTIIKQSDLDKAKKDINEVLNLKIKNELQASGNQAIVYGDVDDKITTQIDAKVGDEKANFNLSAKKKVVIVTFSKDKVAELAKARLSLVVSDDKQLSNFNTNQITYTLENFNEKTATAEIKAYFTGLMSLKSDASLIDRHKLVGLNEKQISEYLNTFPEIKDYELEFWPSFVKSAPNLPDRINIQINK